jgi:cytoskeleton protein RodZ
MGLEHFGSFLKRHREEQGIPVEKVARATRLTPSALLAIEEGSLDQLPPAVFLRGHIAAYANVLQVDEEEAVSLFVYHLRKEAAADAALTPAPSGPWAQLKQRGLGVGVAALVALAAAAALLTLAVCK